jgi:hypothetical protein
MRMRWLRTGAGVLTCFIGLLLTGCQSGQPPATAGDKPDSETVTASDESRAVAEASLGKQSEVLAHGDLALNGREQLLVVNRFGTADQANPGGNTAPIFITRAALLEKNDGRWSEILRCDEHLKNPNGYLGGVPKARFGGWRLQFSKDASAGLELKFSPVEDLVAASGNVGEGAGRHTATFDVRWNKNTKRYQSFDQSHERYLSELPSLETPESSLR